MKDPDDQLNASIEDYLLSLGHSLHAAQRQLGEMATAVSPGDSPITYHIPKLDFEFRLTFELRTSESNPTGRLAVRPAGGGSVAGAVEAASIVKGTFVAVPVRAGKPSPILSTTVERLTNRGLAITATLRNTAGEALAGTEVHFNVDRETSEQMAALDGTAFSLAAGTQFGFAICTTDRAGSTSNGLYVAEDQAGPMPIVILVEAAGVSEKLAYTIPAPAPK